MVMTAVMGLTAHRMAAQSSTPDYLQWYLGGTTGFTVFDWGETPDSYGVHGAYFFNPKYGAGLVFHKRFDGMYSQSILAPTFFAHLGSSYSKWFFPVKVGLGIEFNDRYIACYTSAGVAYRPQPWISIGINADFASAFDYDIEDGLGLSLCIGLHF